ncbi:MAG TPA: ANTAR domain-containing protein [Lapillicoccus sp.]|jgi:hypothetical protein|uniref:ANTAR domain-containing protein n=1 Tax=Lapillicoccus sp. TaxID=1909287 RepID=UPI002F95FC67
MTSDALIRLPHLHDELSAGNGRTDLAAATAEPETEVAQLRAALVSNRRISMAVGIVMRDQNVDEDQAFAYLRRSSQDSNRKLRDVAEDVIRDLRSLPDTRRAERLDS